MQLVELDNLRKPQFIKIGEQIFIYVPVLSKDGLIEFGPDYIVAYPIGIDVGKIRLPEFNQGMVVYTAVGLGEISLVAKKNSWRQAYAVCSEVRKKLVTKPT